MINIPTEVIKGFAGYKASKPNKTHTHMLYTINEYDKQVKTIYQLKREIESLRAENKKEISKIMRTTEEEIKKVKEIAQKKINDISNRLDKVKQQIKQFENININLERF